MLTITPCTERDTVLAYCKKCRIPLDAGHYLYLAENRGERLAACLFEIGGDRVQVLLYESAEPGDAFLFDGVMRAGLNYAAGQGVENGFIPEQFRFLHRALFAKLNYPLQPLFNITNFFNKYKNCGTL